MLSNVEISDILLINIGITIGIKSNNTTLNLMDIGMLVISIFLFTFESVTQLLFHGYINKSLHAFWAIRDLDRRDNPEALFSE